MNPPADHRSRIVRYSQTDGAADAVDTLAVEEPLEIRIAGHAIAVTMRTPAHDVELAAGFLASEGVVSSPADIHRIERCARAADGSVINVELRPGVALDLASLTRHVFASSSCGVCGKATIEATCARGDPIEIAWSINAALLLKLPDCLRAAQPTFDRTGGLHAAALFSHDSPQLLLAREDVGRHNAVDKVIGRRLLDRQSNSNCVLVVSGRTSFEILQKAWAARIPLVAGVSAPTSLAVELAERAGITLVGFLRGERFNVYSHPDRIGMENGHG